MRIENITNTDALLFLAGLAVFIWLVLRIIPGEEVQPDEVYTRDEIRAYDHNLPKYFLVAAGALFLGGLHTVIKNLPGFWTWLWQAGYGGHLFRDLANSHIVIVGGGTMLLTGLTWYVLPRFLNRPLFSESLAGGSYWLTLIGVVGFYVSWLVLGLIEGSMVRGGMTYEAAKAAMGNWHRIPTAVTSSIMGFGYWTYVLNTALTVLAARRVKSKPLGYLAKFSVVSAGALFVGTVQGVIQVLPDSADWIHAAGKFGEYVDPISHAHVNLVTGMMVSLAAFLIYFGPRMGGKRISKRAANGIFWTLVPGSLLFYLAFLLTGLILGNGVNGYGGINSPVIATWLSAHRPLVLGVAGTLMLAGFWTYFTLLWRSLGWKDIGQRIWQGHPAAFWLVSSAALVIGTFQGLLQLIPATASVLINAEEIPNIHAQLNMIGGVLLALIGIAYLLLPELIGEQVATRYRRASLLGIGGGIAGYYLVTLTSGVARLGLLRSGLSVSQAAQRLDWQVPALLVMTALPLFAGFVAFGYGLWDATRAYRHTWAEKISSIPDRVNGGVPAWSEHVPAGIFYLAEATTAMFGFPGLGWLMSGRGLIGVPLALAGPGVAWALVPLLTSPYWDAAPFKAYEGTAEAVYLLASTALSVTGLWLARRRADKRKAAKPQSHAAAGAGD